MKPFNSSSFNSLERTFAEIPSIKRCSSLNLFILIEGENGDEKHKMKSGDFQIMTAGSGIVHTETIDKIAKMRCCNYG